MSAFGVFSWPESLNHGSSSIGITKKVIFVEAFFAEEVDWLERKLLLVEGWAVIKAEIPDHWLVFVDSWFGVCRPEGGS